MDPVLGSRFRSRGHAAVQLLCVVLAGVAAVAAARAVGVGVYSGRFVGGVFVLSLFTFEFVLLAVIPSIFEAKRIRNVLDDDARRAAHGARSRPTPDEPR